MTPFKLIMISAMYENGGNTTQRLLDGHPEMFNYPYESQLGTSLVNDYLSSYVPFKYRWPEFPMHGEAGNDYELFFDEEMKTRLRVPERSKFKNADMKLNEIERKEKFIAFMKNKPRTRANLVEAFFRSTFDAWTNYRKTGQETCYLGYSPVMNFDTEKIMADFPQGHIIHVVRNPYSGYSDTKKRPFPLSLERYTWTWNYSQHLALTYAEKFPNNFHIVRFEDIISDMRGTMSKLCSSIGIGWSETCLQPSWNSQTLKEVYPWGTIRIPTPEVNIATMNQLTDDEKNRIRQLSIVMQRLLGYEQFWETGRVLGRRAA
ncbi:sulfotransferase [Telmatocola sphagniphila]|uniref:Sulfotransferase n=1 Tax=Telmatocola sphagniphila TaxID=1123043 RepID=A0A8E6EY43_9BACT|nr:sulfotransferase [Telmatocola sphagniphila]QVL31991.1 sulfotransferase [Telmatocola sphagniphila]